MIKRANVNYCKNLIRKYAAAKPDSYYMETAGDPTKQLPRHLEPLARSMHDNYYKDTRKYLEDDFLAKNYTFLSPEHWDYYTGKNPSWLPIEDSSGRDVALPIEFARSHYNEFMRNQRRPENIRAFREAFKGIEPPPSIGSSPTLPIENIKNIPSQWGKHMTRHMENGLSNAVRDIRKRNKRVNITPQEFDAYMDRTPLQLMDDIRDFRKKPDEFNSSGDRIMFQNWYRTLPRDKKEQIKNQINNITYNNAGNKKNYV